jgi:hypothetical protein
MNAGKSPLHWVASLETRYGRTLTPSKDRRSAAAFPSALAIPITSTMTPISAATEHEHYQNDCVWNVLGYGGFVLRWELTTNEDSMAKDEHNKAAEHHENAAKAHRSAAEHHGKGDHAKGKEHANSAKQHSQTANQHSDQAHSKSQQQK